MCLEVLPSQSADVLYLYCYFSSIKYTSTSHSQAATMDTSASFMIPHIDPARYAYSQHPTYPHLYLRRAVGPETKWARQAPAYRQLYLTGHVTPLTKSTIQGAFFQAAKRAWMRMRFEYPEIVQLHSGRFYPDGSAIMQCEIPMDEAAARAWVGRTCHTVLDPVGVIGAMEVAEEAMRKRKFADPVAVILQATYSQSAEGKSTSTGAAFSMRVDHGLADGMGAYLLAGKYFRILGEELGGREEEQIDWKEAARRIPKCWVELLNEEQRTEGEDFEEAVRCNINLVMESTVRLATFPRSCHDSQFTSRRREADGESNSSPGTNIGLNR